MTTLDKIADAQRDDGLHSAADLISAYEQGVADLRAAVMGMTEDELRHRPVPGKSFVTSQTASSSWQIE